MRWKNELAEMLNVSYPVVQAPMLGVTTPAMVAAVSNEGGLGSLSVGGLSPERTLTLIRETKALTRKPFAVNLFTHENPKPAKDKVDAMQDFLEGLCADHGIPFERKPIETIPFYSYREQVGILVDEDIPVVSFTFGILDDESIKTLKRKGAILVGTATALAEAELLSEKGIDIISAQGIEAGGHRGSFLENTPLPQIGLMSLVPEIAGSINKPILAAGGISNGKAIQAAFTLGAKGVQIGTAFLASDESMAAPSYKSAVRHSHAGDSVLTSAFSGRWARAIPNIFTREVERSGIEILPYPAQHNFTIPIRAAAQRQDNKDFIALFAGQSGSGALEKPAAEIFRHLILSEP